MFTLIISRNECKTFYVLKSAHAFCVLLVAVNDKTSRSASHKKDIEDLTKVNKA